MNRRGILLAFLTVVGLVLILLLGYLLGLRLMPTPQIAVVRIEGDIWGLYTDYLRDSLRQAADDPAVSAIVLEIVSPGGEVTASEDLYFEILNLRETKPVVASIDEIAASGAYYVAAAADQIYAKPGSTVGNIGVISILPSPDLVDEQLFTTGPFKLSGGSQLAAIRQMEMLKDTFLEAILSQRADRLQVGPDVLSRGEVYLGLQAQQMGLVDEVGARGDAIAAAARLALVRHYEVVDRTPELPEELAFFGFKLERAMTATLVAAPPRNLPPGFYFRYLEPPQ
jgi:protease-4